MELAVIDDHPLLLDAVAVAVRSLPGVATDTFGTIEAYDEAVANGKRYDLVLLDLGLPGFADLAALKYFRQWHDDTPVVVLSATHDRDTIVRALELNAMGFIPKTSPQGVLRGAINVVASGGVFVPSEVLLRDPGADTGSDGQAKDAPARAHSLARGLSTLTPRQRDVLEQLVKGLPNKLICRHLGLSPNTIKAHLSAIFRALDVTNRTEAVIVAQTLGLRFDMRRPDK
jgi:DNA-binding NarL/FixJ family response regulator